MDLYRDSNTYGILKKLRTRQDIVIVRPDKGNGVVVLDRDIYKQKILEIINDTAKFKKLKDNPTLTREGQLQRFLRKIKDKNLFDENTYKKIYPCSSKLATIYGLPKTHKMLFDSDDFSLRPIISSIGPYNYNLAKFLTELLDPIIPKEHCAKDLFSFCEEIQQVSNNDNFLVSYDVCSLFTSTPLQETIEIAVEVIFENNPQLKITKRELKQLFSFATSGTHFMFSGSFYDKIDGISMGSPLGPVLANLLMGYHEKKWLQEFDKGKILMYKRYVDDIFCMFENEKDAENFFEFLNCQHKSIKFTLEKESNKFLSFLDVLIKNEGNCFSTSVYRKKTLVGLFTQFNSFTPISYKIGLVRCLIYRAFKISGSYIIFHNELEKVKILLQKNILMLKHICERFCNDIDISNAFSLLKLSSFFSCKDTLPKSLQCYVVYQFICAGCKTCYIGETKCYLNTRIEEHLGKDKKSHIYSHLQEYPQCQERVNFGCFEIIDCASSYFRLQIKEAMHINWKKTELNKQVKHVGITISI